MTLPRSAKLLDVYAGVAAHLASSDAGTAAAATAAAAATTVRDGHADVELLPRADGAVPIDKNAFRLLLASTPLRPFTSCELETLSLADACVLDADGATTRAAAAAAPFTLRLAVESAAMAAWAVLKVSPRCTARVLRLAVPAKTSVSKYAAGYRSDIMLQPALPSPIVHLRNADGAHGVTLFTALRTLLHPDEWHTHTGGVYGTYNEVALRADQKAAVTAALYASPLYSAHPSTEPLQAYARALLHRAAVRVGQQGDGSVAARRAAADDLEVSRAFSQVFGLLYHSNGMLGDHVDNGGSYTVLLSLGCAINFAVDGTVLELASGDALIFHSGAAHGVLHGMRGVRAGTCPPQLPAELHDKRLSVVLRQQHNGKDCHE